MIGYLGRTSNYLELVKRWEDFLAQVSFGLTIQEAFCLRELVFAMLLSGIPNGHALVTKQNKCIQLNVFLSLKNTLSLAFFFFSFIIIICNIRMVICNQTFQGKRYILFLNGNNRLLLVNEYSHKREVNVS